MRSKIRSSTIIWIVGVIILISLLGWATVRILNHPDEPAPDQSENTDVSVLPQEGMPLVLSETYRNSTYGFEISYPSHLRTRPFTAFHALRDNWRVNATPDERGTPIVAIPVFRLESYDTTPRTYPLFFAAEVRVGVSSDTEQCYKRDDGYTMQTVADVKIDGEMWKKFIFGDAAMMQYLSGASYRTTRNGLCYVVEQIRTGNVYKDDSMEIKFSDRELDALYEQTTPIVMSFEFTE